MAETKIYFSDKIDTLLREYSMKRFGYRRGSISDAVEEAVTQWLKKETMIKDAVQKLVEHAKEDENIIAMVLFGSYARKEPGFNDVDIGLLAKDPGNVDILRYTYILEGASENLIQLSVINDFPRWTQKHIIDESRLLYVKDREALYEYTSKLIIDSSDNEHIAALLRS